MPTRHIDITALDTASAYKLLVGAVQPRPIAWVSTIGADGSANLAPFSFFTVASREPATLLVSIGPKIDGGIKDTLANVRATGDFVVNVASFDHHLAVSTTGQTVAPEVDEFELADLTPVASDVVRAPRVAEARLAIECRLREEHRIGTDTVIYGTAVRVHAAEGVLDDSLRVDNDVLNPLGRLAGPWFSGPLMSIPEGWAPTATVTRD
ncbi:flavin reductase family protein [Mycolicibacterium sp. jd]|uniref:flavin reductase family protein n=1 Tax=unclassified Mycolicibacterium TaxID=2636767 RepID=UPI00351B5B62